MSVTIRNVNVHNKKEALEEIIATGADMSGCRLMSPKGVHRLVKLTGLSPKQANIIKQQMLSKGGEAAVSRGVIDCSASEATVLIMGTLKQFDGLVNVLKMQPFSLPKIGAQIKQVLKNLEGRTPVEMDCRGRSLILGERTLVMGILNITPDSFSDGGNFYDHEVAIEHAKAMVVEGADIIDLGGESTKPGYKSISVEEELDRVIPVLEKLVKVVDVPISIDTTKAEVARRALDAGAHLVNDQWALRADPEMAKVVAEYQVPLIIMHNQKGTEYNDLMGDMVQYFEESIELAVNAGLAREKIIVDPGIGFGKTLEQNLETMRRMDELSCLGCPVLLGTSRKSMIGKVLDLPVTERVEGTAATVTLGIVNGVDIVRVHNVKEMVRVARMTDAMVRR